MSQIKSIDEFVNHPENNHLTQKRKNPAIYLLLAVAGIAMIVLNYAVLDQSQAALASTLLLLGAVAVIWGVAGALFNSRKGNAHQIYLPTGERLKSFKVYYNPSEKGALCQAFESGELGRILKLKPEEGSGVMFEAKATPSGSYLVAQVHEYIPHNYRPATDVRDFRASDHPDVTLLVESLRKAQ